MIEQEKKNKKKKSRLEKSVNEEKDDDDTEFIINKFDDEEDFIPFENENEKSENVSHARHVKHDNLRTNHSIDDEFNWRDFFDDMNDERAFETLYS